MSVLYDCRYFRRQLCPNPLTENNVLDYLLYFSVRFEHYLYETRFNQCTMLDIYIQSSQNVTMYVVEVLETLCCTLLEKGMNISARSCDGYVWVKIRLK